MSVTGGDYFGHQLIYNSKPARVSQQTVGGETVRQGTAVSAGYESIEARATGDSQAVERNVPNELFPVGAFEIIGNRAGDPGVAKSGSDLVSARFGPALEFADFDFAMGEMMNDAGFGAVQANEAKPAENLFDGKKGGEGFFIAQAVLKRQERGVRSDQGREQRREEMIDRGFERDDHQVAGADLSGILGGAGTSVEIAFRTEDLHAMAPDLVEIRTEKKMDLVSCAPEFGAVIAADRTGSDDSDLHVETFDSGGGRCNKKGTPWGVPPVH